MSHLLCFLVTLVLQICHGLGQDLPPVACPDNFEYLKFNDRYVGLVSVVLNGSATENNVKVELCVRGVVVSPQETVGELKFLDSGSSLKDKVKNNESVSLQMDLSSPDGLPKLTRIVVNGETICRDKPYDIPFTTFARETVLRTRPSDRAEDILGTN